jgi:RimJ/RimL family protein N-acetyltransferase
MIEGRLTSLRPVEREDLEFLRNLANDPGTAGMVVGWDFPVSMHGQELWLQKDAASGSGRRLIVQENPGATVLGTASLSELDWHNRDAEVGVKIAYQHRGHGFGTDAIMTLAAWAFYVVGLRRLHTTILAFNTPSLDVFIEKCGWRVEGRELESVFRKGSWCDAYKLAILRREFTDVDGADEYIERLCPIDVTSTSIRLQP